MTSRAVRLIRQHEKGEPEIELIPNRDAVKLLKNIYMGGKNRGNPDARWADTSRGKDYVRFRLPLSKINNVEQPAKGIVDPTVNVEYAKTLIGKKLPPLLIGRTLSVIDGGHRYYAAFHGHQREVEVIMRQDFFDYARARGLL